jgi:hypothetical protein
LVVSLSYDRRTVIDRSARSTSLFVRPRSYQVATLLLTRNQDARLAGRDRQAACGERRADGRLLVDEQRDHLVDRL